MTETFDLSPAYPLAEDDLQHAVSTQATDGPVHRQRIWPRKLRRWKLALQHMQLAHVTRLRTLWTTTAAGALRMNWTPPGGSQIAVRFVGGELVVNQSSAVHFSSEVTLEEVRVSP